MKKTTHNEIEKILTTKNVSEELLKFNVKKAVLGIDIYRYSQFAQVPQMLIPHLFKSLYDLTVNNCLKCESLIFKEYNLKDFRNNFIDTGDGGFQIFNNPFQGIIFAIYFQANIFRYNTNHEYTSELFEIIDEITLRYSLTFDDIYSYEKNFFGPAIINCARLISKDKLNRFLIDENTKKWFIKEMNSFENIAYLSKDDFKNFTFIELADSDDFSSSVLFGEVDDPKIKRVDLLKIGEIRSKLDILSVYNIQIQTLMYSHPSKFMKMAITLGNLNIHGLE